jgi:hypothetical protein
MGINLKYLKSILRRPGLPIWFVRLNYLGLSAIIIWPLILFGAIFMFDNPKNFLLTFFLFILIISYPVLFIGNMLLSVKLYEKQKLIATLLPLISFGLFDYFLFLILNGES